MSLSTIEKPDVIETPPKNFGVYHMVSMLEALNVLRGFPFMTLCGLKKKPNPKLEGVKHQSDLTPMERCVMCETIYLSQK